MYHSMYIICTNTIIGNQNTDEYMSEISAIYEHVLTVAADQLTTASRASLCIASPMVKVTEQCIAIVASSGFRSSLVEVPWGTNLDAVVYLAANVDFSNTAALGFHHILAAYLATVNNIVSGRNRSATISTIKKLCDGFGITIEQFFQSDLFRNLEQEIE